MPIPPQTPKNLRTFALGILVICGALTGLMIWREHSLAAWILGAFAGWGLVSLLWLKLITPLYVVFGYFGLGLGWVNTRLVLGLMFYLVFTPMGVIMRLFGRDPLKKGIDKTAPSYWRDADPPPTPDTYRRQF
jgi:hypothetical protein